VPQPVPAEKFPKPHLIFVNRYYWPDEPATAQLLTDLAEGLAARGWPVVVLASQPGGAATPWQETHNGVEIIRAPATRWGRRGVVAKALDFLTFSLGARRVLRARLRANDWLVAMTDPPTLAPIAASVAGRTQARLVHWLQDIHPEITIALSGSRMLACLCRPWIHWRNAAWQQADACVAISRDMAALVAENGVPAGRVRVIPNWAPGSETMEPVPAEKNALLHQWGLEGRFVVAYSGNLGRVHALEPLLAAAVLLRDEPDIRFLFIGSGAQKASLQAMARADGLTNVQFHPAQPRTRLAESLSVGDVHLVTQRTGCERLVFPSKLYGILAVGRPVVYVGPLHCELAKSVTDNGAGVAVNVNNPGQIATTLRWLQRNEAQRRLMGQAALRWHRGSGSVKAAVDAWEQLLAVRTDS
jgi:glycosyltransferase involved in cell wall biosynthesis